MKFLKVTYPDINNGVGCRATIWFAGCSHHCKGCHNEWTWNYNQGTEVENELYDKIAKLFEENEYLVGITLSGGDPLSQSNKDLCELLNFVEWFTTNYPDKTIWLYTGDILEDCMMHHIKKDIIKHCDVVVDGPFIEEQKDLSLAFRGSRNQRIIYVKDIDFQ